MIAHDLILITPQELAQRWGRSESAIRFSSAVGVGPRYIKTNGLIKYPMEEVEKYERACMVFERTDEVSPVLRTP